MTPQEKFDALPMMNPCTPEGRALKRVLGYLLDVTNTRDRETTSLRVGIAHEALNMTREEFDL